MNETMAHSCNSSTWKDLRKDCEVRANLGYMVRPWLKHKQQPPEAGQEQSKKCQGLATFRSYAYTGFIILF